MPWTGRVSRVNSSKARCLNCRHVLLVLWSATDGPSGTWRFTVSENGVGTWFRARSLALAPLTTILRLMSGRRQVRMSGRSTEPWFVSTWAQIDTNVITQP